jgi:lysophospholipase L1-like esterase/dienelactone hydrolase
MNKKFYLIFTIFMAFSITATAQSTRFKSEIYTTVDTIGNISYGESINLKGEKQTLVLDVFMPPKGDTMLKRPLVIFIHGGGFRNGTKVGGFGGRLCRGFAKRGYVASSITYRLGVANGRKDTAHVEALYRAVQDGKAAVRFFRKNADVYGIDTAQIFVMGSSAGAMIALHIAYWDENEVPDYIDTTKMGTLEGTSGNAGFSSKVHGVINCWGAMPKYKWLAKGDVPLYNVVGMNDKTVPYDSSYAWNSFKYGPYILYQRALQVGISTGYRPFENTGHTLDNNVAKQDSAFKDMSAWLYTQLRYHGGNTEGMSRFAKDIKAFEELDKKETYSSNAVLFTGSSYIRLWSNIKTDLAPYEIIHRGFGGSNVREMAYYIPRILAPHKQLKAIVFYTGSNDITVSAKDKSPREVLEMFKYIVKTVRQTHPTTPIYWIEISPNERRWKVWENIQDANRLFKEYAAQTPNVHVIEAASSLLGDDKKPVVKWFKDDKLHPNDEGYKMWAEPIRKALPK